MDIFFEEILKRKNRPIIDEEYDQKNHLILSKYTSKVYYKYSIELLKTLVKKSQYINKTHIFHMSLYFLLKVLYNFKNIPYIDNYDLLILTSLSLGIKTSIDQHKTPFITILKNIYPEKYSSYSNEKIQICEIIYMKLLDYNINILTPYDCLYYIFNEDLNKFTLFIKELESIIFNSANEILFKKPYELALESINNYKIRIQNIKQPLLITKKTVPFLNKKEYKNNESTPTTSFSSYGSNNNTRNNFNSKRLKNLRSQPNIEIFNNNNIINNINNELNIIYKNMYNIILRCNNSESKKKDNNGNSIFEKNINYNHEENNEIIKIIYKKSKGKIYEFYMNKNPIFNNNIKLLNNSLQNKSISKDIFINTTSNKNDSKHIEEHLQKNKIIYFSNQKPSKKNSKININNIINKNEILIHNISKNNIKKKIIYNDSGNTIFKKPTIDKQKMKTSFKAKNTFKFSKKESNINSALKNCNKHYRKISDLCQKINFDVLNNISKDKESINY